MTPILRTPSLSHILAWMEGERADDEPSTKPGRAERPSLVLPSVLALLALAVAIGAVAAEARSPDKGFVAFVGREVTIVTAGSAVDAAGIRPGDTVVAVDGREVVSVLDYARDVLSRDVGDPVSITFETAAGRRVVDVTLQATPTPWIGIVAIALSLLMLALGLVALRGRPSPASRRFFRTTIVFTLIYGGSLYWNHLIPVPWLAIGPIIAMYAAPPVVLEFLLGFPVDETRRDLTWGARIVSISLGLGAGWSFWAAIQVAQRGEPPDVELGRAVAFIGLQLVFVLVCFVVGVAAQARALGRSRGSARAQRKWLLLGFGACLVPLLAAVPFAIDDYGAFLLGGMRPFVTTLMFVWFGASALAVLRVRLADVDAVIHRSATYVLTVALAALVYLVIALGFGLAFDRFVPGTPWASQLFGAAVAALLFGPIHRRVSAWIERRFFRDRLHYVRALRELSDALLEVRELDELCRAVVERSVDAVRATGGALYLIEPDEETLRLAHSVGDAEPSLSMAEALDAAIDGVAIPIEDDRFEGVLRLESRRAGDLYSSDDRDLLETLAGRVAIALASSRTFTTIGDMSRTLEAQNVEIAGLRDKLEDENRYLKGRLDANVARGIVGGSRAIELLRKRIARLANGAATVLIRGESGTGKSLVARALHDASDRAGGPFVHVDCGSLAKGVFESELFGHERGAFTGAVRTRRGCFELADGGTLFLDEIGELPLELQPKLLRVLQERSFTRLGGSALVSVDVRILAATHRDLDAMIESGELRQDLYYRLSVITLDVPALRERRADVAMLVDDVFPKLCQRNHRPLRPLSNEALAALTTYDWPGNVRELQNVLERAAVLADGATIERSDLALPERLVRAPVTPSSPPPPTHREEMDVLERERLAQTLADNGGNKSKTAKALGMPRTTLISKLRKHGLV